MLRFWMTKGSRIQKNLNSPIDVPGSWSNAQHHCWKFIDSQTWGFKDLRGSWRVSFIMVHPFLSLSLSLSPISLSHWNYAVQSWDGRTDARIKFQETLFSPIVLPCHPSLNHCPGKCSQATAIAPGLFQPLCCLQGLLELCIQGVLRLCTSLATEDLSNNNLVNQLPAKKYIHFDPI